MSVLKPPPLGEIFGRMTEGEGRFEKIFAILSTPDAAAPGGAYRHWDTLRHLKPPGDLTHEEWWAVVKLARNPLMREFSLTDSEGVPFRYATPDEALRILHYVDQHAAGEISMPEFVGDEAGRGYYLANSLIEEAIRSSQLEGAATTRAVAKEMIRSGREPRDRSERMILNNYRAMEFIREEMRSELTVDQVLELHRVITEGTLDEPRDAGRLQTPADERVAVWEGEHIVHHPPPAHQLPERLERMCQFANAESEEGGFLHPVARSILLHFWVGYDHPFADGNGRTARGLFYWSMRKRGYWLTEYTSISSILRNAPSKYTKAFLYTETDERDSTYFLIYQLQIFKRAIEELTAYVSRKMSEVRAFEQRIRATDEFNHRQLALLANAVRHPDQRYTFRSHAVSHRVTHETARHDLTVLAEKGLLESRQSGRKYVFSPVARLQERLEARAASV